MKEHIEKFRELYERQLEQNQYNEKISMLYTSLSSQEEFNKINIYELRDILEKDYDINVIDSIINTIRYVQVNDNLLEVKDDLLVIFEKYFLKKEAKYTLLECENIINKCNLLNEALSNEELYIEDLDFVFQIFKELNLDMDTILLCVKEIDQHNRMASLSSVKKEEMINTIHEIDEIEHIEEFDIYSESVDKKDDNPFIKYVEENSQYLSLFEKNLLLKRYEEEKDVILELFDFINMHSGLIDLKNDLSAKKTKRLFVSIIAFSNIDILNNLSKICYEQQIEFSKLLVNFFISETNNSMENLDDEFYKELTGCYECFIEIINRFSNNKIDLPKLIRECSSIFTINKVLIENNLKVLKEYQIPLTNSSLQVLIVENLKNKIDRFIEMGLYDYVKKMPTALLTNDQALFHRIYWAKKNNKPIKKLGLMHEIKDLNGYDINRSNYLEKVVVYKPETFTHRKIFVNSINNQELVEDYSQYEAYFEELQKYEQDGFYNIEGICISKRKALRIFKLCYEEVDKIKWNDHFELKKRSDIIISLIVACIGDLILDVNDTKKLLGILFKEFNINLLNEEYNFEIDPLYQIGEIFGLTKDELDIIFNNNVGKGIGYNE